MCATILIYESASVLQKEAVKLDARLTLRITSETKEALAKEAKRQRRSVNALAKNILEDWASKHPGKPDK